MNYYSILASQRYRAQKAMLMDINQYFVFGLAYVLNDSRQMREKSISTLSLVLFRKRFRKVSPTEFVEGRKKPRNEKFRRIQFAETRLQKMEFNVPRRIDKVQTLDK